MNISGINSASSITQNMQQAEIKVRSDATPTQTSVSQTIDPDTVSISDAAQKKLSTELGTAMHKNSANTKAQQSEQVDTRTETEKKIDKLKEELKELKELKEERQALANDHSEAAEQKRKEIDTQMMMLNVQLTTLLKAQKDEAESDA